MPDHFKQFADFCRHDRAAGGPDPHMACMGAICQDQAGTEDTLWLGALYCSVYNVPTAVALYTSFPSPAAILALDCVELAMWLEEHWKGIAFRRERKAVRSVVKLAQCLQSVAGWCLGPTGQWTDYEAAFEDVTSNIYGFGRYIGQKFLEYGRRYCGFNVMVPDIRPDEGWSPREGLALLYPDYAPLVTDEDNSPYTLDVVNNLAAELKQITELNHGVALDYYELQVFLCDYKQCWSGQRQYPGRSQDSELDYEATIGAHWGSNCLAMRVARERVFPAWALGEKQGWTGVRKELGKVLRNAGYMWSDQLYNWHTSKGNLSQPVARE